MYNLAQSFKNLLTELNNDPLSKDVDALLVFVAVKIKTTASNSKTEVKVTILCTSSKNLVKQLPNAAALLKPKGIDLLYKQRQQKDGYWILAKLQEPQAIPTKAIIKLPTATNLRQAA